MGHAIAWYEQGVRRLVRGPVAERAAGILLAVGLPALAYGAGRLAIEWAGRVHAFGRTAAVVALAWTMLAARDLADHALAVSRSLEAGDLQGARQAVARIVGRDTDGLPEPEIVRATVETIAESASDGVIAPLLYLAVGGPPLALAYKAINTLDSMVGHRDERYRYVGWASARLDDAANWLPARLSALLLVVAAWLARRHAGGAWLVLRRDGHKHPSPNSGRPEAAMAGALGVQLGGINLYGGVPCERPRLGDPATPLGARHIADALSLMALASALALGLALAVRAL
jgi:adenosylcobinamide-phosphate synthase